jgi:type II secretory pathway pseudopilin PulG
MAASREITIRIVAETADAQQRLGAIRDRIEQLGRDVKAGAISWDQYETQLQAVVHDADRLQKELSQTARVTQDQTQATQRGTTALQDLHSLLLRYVSAAAIGSAIRSTTEWAGRLTDLAARTGISTQTLQKFELAAKLTGGTLDEVVIATQRLQQRLFDPTTNKSVVAAAERLGLSFKQLREQRPDEAFAAVAQALAQIERPGERVALVTELMGRGAEGVLPAMLALADVLKQDVPLASEASLQKLDDLGDAISELWQRGKVLIAEIFTPLVPILQALAGLLRLLQPLISGVATAFAKLVDAMAGRALREARENLTLWFGTVAPPGAPGRPRLPMGEPITAPGLPPDLDQILRQPIATPSEGGRASARGRRAFVAGVTIRPMTPEDAAAWVAAMPTLPLPPPEIMRTGLVPARGLPGGGMITLPLSPTPVSPGTARIPWFERLFGTDFAPSIASTILGSLMGGGSVGRSLGGLAGGAFFSGSVGNLLARGAMNLFGSTIGGALGSILPGVGTWLGSMVGGLFGKLFGGSEESRVVNPKRDEFLAQFGGAQALAARLAELPVSMGGGVGGGRLMQDLFDAKKAKDFEQAVRNIVNALEQYEATQGRIKTLESQIETLRKQQAVSWKDMERIAREYGIEIDALGQEFQQLKGTDFATKILNDFDVLKRGGADVGTILFGMKEEFSELVRFALKFGVALPENLRPMVEELARAGLLTDEFGNKIEDVSQLTWGEPVKTQSEILGDAIQKLVEELEKLRQTLAGELPRGAREGLEETDRILRGYEPPEIEVPYRFRAHGPGPGEGGGDEFASAGGLVTPDGLRTFARGGLVRGLDRIPALLEPGEFVFSRGAVQRLGARALQALNRGASFAVGDIHVTVDARESVFDEVSAQALARKLATALTTELQRRGGLTPVVA